MASSCAAVAHRAGLLQQGISALNVALFQAAEHVLAERQTFAQRARLAEGLNAAQATVQYLRVGGQAFHVDSTAWAAWPDSMLALMFRGPFQVERDAEGYALLDRDPALFALVRTYAADGVAPDLLGPTQCKALQAEAAFFGLPALRDAMKPSPCLLVGGGLRVLRRSGLTRPAQSILVHSLSDGSSNVLTVQPIANLYETAAALVGRRLYLCGGMKATGEAVPTIDVFDPACGGWRRGPSLRFPRRGAAAVQVGSQLWVIGGAASDGTPLGSIEAFDLATEQWGWAPPPLAVPRRAFAAGVVGGLPVVAG
eukprot:EG_transcript_20138